MSNTAPIGFDAVTANSFRTLAGDVAAGQVARFSYSVQEQRDELWDMLTGLRLPRRGRLFVAGNDLYALTASQRLHLLQGIGVVSHDGGLISNLRVWENIVLPVWYHRGRAVPELEQPVARIFSDFGLEPRAVRELMARLPDQLNAGERCAVALARALLMEPDIMIYQSPFTGVERETATRLLRLMLQYHRARAERVSVFILPDEPFSERVPADVSIAVEA